MVSDTTQEDLLQVDRAAEFTEFRGQEYVHVAQRCC